MAVTAVPEAYGVIESNPLQVAARGVLANDSDTTGRPLTVASSTQPAHGTLAMNANGAFTYTPATDFVGADSFTYTASDGLTNATATVSLTVVACTPDACVFAGPRLASVNSTQGPLLNAVMGSLLGSNLNLTAVDWTSLANSSLNESQLLGQIQSNLLLASPSQALATNITMTQFLTAAAQVAQTNGNTAQATAFNNLLAQQGPATGTFQLGSLLQGELNNGSMADADLNALDLVTGTAQLFNFQNVATTPTPTTISGAELSALGLPATVGSLDLSAQVVEPPIFTCGPAGTEFHTAALRFKFDLNNLTGLNLDTSSLLAPIAAALGVPAGLVTATGNVDHLVVYVEVASASGTIEQIDELSGAVTLQATPSLANVYIGNIADNVFFNRTHIINPATDLTFGTVGTLAITAGLTNESGQIQFRDFALGQAPNSPTTLTFNPPYPAPAQTVGSSATAVTNLSSQLATNMQVQVNGNMGPLLNPIAGTLASDLVQPAVNGVVTPIVSPLLSGVVDPMLETLGIGIGEAIVAVDSVGMICPPIANNDHVTTPQNTPINVPVLNNDAFMPGDDVTITATTPPAHGTRVVNTNGTITYTPTTGYIGPDTFTYTITDGTGTPSTATVTVLVTALPPVANNDSYSTTAGKTLAVAAPGVQGNDSNPGGGTLTSTRLTQPSHGTVTFNANGSFSYVPNAGYTGPDSFTYRDSNGNATSNIATVSINVTPAAPPVANNDAYSTPAGTTLTVNPPGVQGNDTNPGGGTLTSTRLTQPSHGTLTFNPNGSFTYVPAAGYTGPDSFTYRDSNGTATSNTATVSLNVTPAAPPVANNDAYSTTEGTTLTIAAPGVQGNDSNPGGGTLTSTALTQPAHGTLTLNSNGSFTYVPAAGYTGPDSFTYDDSNGNATSNTATVSLNVTPAAPPVANNDAYSTPVGTTLVVATPGVQGNDTNPGGGTLTSTALTQPAHGTLTLNPNGSLTYVPDAGFTGPDSFTYNDSDGNSTSNTATVTLNVTPLATVGPVANNDAYSTPEGTALTVAAPGVQTNDTNPGGGTLSSTIQSQPAHGTVTFNTDGSFIYVPNPGFVGADSFTYNDSDGTNTSNTATVSLAVTPTAPPIANNDAYSTSQGTTLTIAAPGVQGNDVSPTGRPLTSTIVAQPAHGTLSFNADGSFTYSPDAQFVGADAFTYTDSDGNNTSNIATVTLTVTAALAPIANDDAYSTPEGTTLIVAAPGVQGNDTNPGGGTLTSTILTQPLHGTVTLNPNGSLTYVPDAGFVGGDSFTYDDSNGTTTSNPATVTLNVTPTPPPVANDDTYTAPNGTTITVSGPGVQVNDTSPTGQPLNSTIVTEPAHGTVTLNSDGSFTYDPVDGYVGPDSFTYVDSDGNNTSSPATVAINVTRAATSGPSVAALQRFGFHMQPTLLVLSFNTALEPSRAQDISNYILRARGGRGRVIPLSSATYDPTSHTVTLVPASVRLRLRASYALTVNGTTALGVTDSTGALLDGDANGQPGGDYTAVFNRSILAGPSTTFGRTASRAGRSLINPAAAHSHASAAAVDALFTSGAHHNTLIPARLRRQLPRR